MACNRSHAVLQKSVDFSPRIQKGLLKHAHRRDSKNHKAQVFRAICRVATHDGDFSLAKLREIPGVRKIFESARQVEINALKTKDEVIENVGKGDYRLTPVGKRLAIHYTAGL